MHSSLFMGLFFAANSDESKSAPVAELPYLFRAHVREPLPRPRGQIGSTVIFTGSYNDEAFGHLARNEFFKNIRPLIGVKDLSNLDIAVNRIDNDNVQAPVVTVAISLQLNLDIIDHDGRSVAAFIPS